MPKVRVGDNTGTASAKFHGDEVRLVYRSGARRVVHRRNVATEGKPTPAERELMLALVDAGDAGILHPPIHLRVAAAALIRAGYATEDGRILACVMAHHVRPAGCSRTYCGHACLEDDGWMALLECHPEDIEQLDRCSVCYARLPEGKLVL